MEVVLNDIQDSLTPVGSSDLGTLVYDNIVFPAGVYVDLDGNNQVYNEVKLDAVVFSVNRLKEIVTSKVSGRNGEITEYISHGDYTVTLDAIVASENVDAATVAQIAAGFLPGVQGVAGLVGLTSTAEPVVFLDRIKRLDDVPDRVEIRNKILQNVYGINFVVIKSFKKDRVGSDAWRISMELKDDRDVDLKDFG